MLPINEKNINKIILVFYLILLIFFGVEYIIVQTFQLKTDVLFYFYEGRLNLSIFYHIYLLNLPGITLALVFGYLLLKKKLFNRLHLLHKINIIAIWCLILHFFIINILFVSAIFLKGSYYYILPALALWSFIPILPAAYLLVFFQRNATYLKRAWHIISHILLLNCFYVVWAIIANFSTGTAFPDLYTGTMVPMFAIIPLTVLMTFIIYGLASLHFIWQKIKQTYFSHV